MRLPAIVSEANDLWSGFAGFCAGRKTIQRTVDAVGIVIVLEVAQLSLEVGGAPEGNMIQIVSADRADESLDERV